MTPSTQELEFPGIPGRPVHIRTIAVCINVNTLLLRRLFYPPKQRIGFTQGMKKPPKGLCCDGDELSIHMHMNMPFNQGHEPDHKELLTIHPTIDLRCHLVAISRHYQ